jgi:hypothetical protein
MADPKVKIRRSSTPGKIPTTAQIELGELAINTYDGAIAKLEPVLDMGAVVAPPDPEGVGMRRRRRKGPRKVSAYNRFVGAQMRKGKSMAQAAKAWRGKKRR